MNVCHRPLGSSPISRYPVNSINGGKKQVFTNLQMEDGLVIGLTSSNDILFRCDHSKKALTQASMATLDLDSSIAAKELYPVQLSLVSQISDVAVSDSGDRLAWILEADDRRCPPRVYSFCISGLRRRGNA